ncbi:MAG: potassium transporter TrkG [Bacteroidales bacterium]|nr:potassium transporter TrkG [Bacteroidales bacterium]
MINYRTVLRIFGALLMLESAAMTLSLVVSVIYHEEQSLPIFLAAMVTLAAGFTLHILFRKNEIAVGRREGYIIVTGSWVLFSIFGTLPFLFSHSIPSVTDAFFETMSGFTTTGASVLSDIEALSHGILFWRSITQWMGGMGIVVLSLAVLSEIKIGNFQLFAAEVPGVTKDKLHPKVKETAKRLWAIYMIFTLAETLLLMLGGMSPFDAVCHSFTTMATGGYSTKNASIAAFDSPYIHLVITLFMFLAGINFALTYFLFMGKPGKLLRNDEFRFYSLVCIFFTVIVSLSLWIVNGNEPFRAFVDGAFQVVSIITTTGFATANYELWGHFLILIIFILMFTGGSTGSTGGGIKMLRIMILAQNSRQELHRLIHPNAVIPVRINGKAIQPSLINNVLAFVVFYFLVTAASVVIISFMGYDVSTSFGAVAASLGNIGPGIGDVGPLDNYAHFPAFGKWFLSFIMLIGRLELFTVLILFSRTFYRN